MHQNLTNKFLMYLLYHSYILQDVITTPQKKGRAYSTTSVGIFGLHLLNSYQKKNSEPFLENITEEYIEEDNIKLLLT